VCQLLNPAVLLPAKLLLCVCRTLPLTIAKPVAGFGSVSSCPWTWADIVLLPTFFHPAVYVRSYGVGSNSLWPGGSLQLNAAQKGWSRRCFWGENDQAASSSSRRRVPCVGCSSVDMLIDGHCDHGGRPI